MLWVPIKKFVKKLADNCTVKIPEQYTNSFPGKCDKKFYRLSVIYISPYLKSHQIIWRYRNWVATTIGEPNFMEIFA